MARGLRSLILGLLCAGITACETALPEPDSVGAQLYRQRCSGCHRLYQPGLLTPEMWQFMLARMDTEFVRLGRPPFIRNRAPHDPRLPQHPRPASGRLRPGGVRGEL